MHKNDQMKLAERLLRRKLRNGSSFEIRRVELRGKILRVHYAEILSVIAYRYSPDLNDPPQVFIETFDLEAEPPRKLPRRIVRRPRKPPQT
jgi:hypothetical protein